MTIYTRRGDAGTTSLADGERVSKASARVEAYGTVDEANSAVGLARAVVSDPILDDVLHFIQQRLFNCSSSIATPAENAGERTPHISGDDITALEQAVDRFEAESGALNHFIIESGCEAAARLHVARATIRRAERRTVALAADTPVDEGVLKFLNRCSDALFAAARYANKLEDIAEEAWDPATPPPMK